MLTIDQIRNITFERVGMKGYRATDVDGFIDEVLELLEKNEAEKADLESKMELLAEKVEEYRKDEDSLREALLNAQKLGNSIVAEARQKADIVLNDAKIKAETLISKAQDKVTGYQQEEVQMRAEVTTFKNALLSLYKEHIELISKLPSNQEEPQQDAEDAAQQPEVLPEESSDGLAAAPSAEETSATPNEPALDSEE